MLQLQGGWRNVDDNMSFRSAPSAALASACVLCALPATVSNRHSEAGTLPCPTQDLSKREEAVE